MDTKSEKNGVFEMRLDLVPSDTQYNNSTGADAIVDRSVVLRGEMFALLTIHSNQRQFQAAFREVTGKHPEEALCFLDVAGLRKHVEALKTGFENGDKRKRFAYAVKANPHPDVLNVVCNAGVTHFDCASPNEAAVVHAVAPDRNILYNHPVAKGSDIAKAVANGVNRFTIQSFSGLRRVLRHTTDLRWMEISVRVTSLNPSAEINLSTKFGAPEGRAETLLRRIKEVDPRRVKAGISTNAGSQNTNKFSFIEAIIRICNIAKRVGGVRTVNIGGGLPVSYERGFEYDLGQYMQVINAALSECLDSDRDVEEIIIELGRAVVAQSVNLVIPVIEVEEGECGSLVYFDDGVFTSFSDVKVHDWTYDFRVLRPDGKEKTGNLKRTILFGRTCDSGDKLPCVMLPEIEEGDYIWVPNAGAYMDSQSSYFNGFGPPRYVTYNSY